MKHGYQIGSIKQLKQLGDAFQRPKIIVMIPAQLRASAHQWWTLSYGGLVVVSTPGFCRGAGNACGTEHENGDPKAPDRMPRPVRDVAKGDALINHGIPMFWVSTHPHFG